MGRSMGGGSSGGGRSFGGGGGRSFGGGNTRSGSSGGRSMGGSSSRSSNSFGGNPYSGGSSSRPMMGGLPFGMGRTRTVFVPMGQNRYGSTRRQPVQGGGYQGDGPGGPDNNGRRNNGGTNLGCLILILVALFIVLVFTILPYATGGSGSSAVSTVRREPLAAGSVKETGYYTDELGWIKKPSVLTAGMKEFYQKTGVQPYLYLFEEISGDYYPQDSKVEAAAEMLYDSLFEDEAHLLVLFWEYGNEHEIWYLAGTQAASVIDSEAGDILIDSINRYYYDSSLSEDELFSKAFSEAGEKIMTVTVPPAVYMGWAMLALAALALIIFWRNKRREAQLKKDEETRRILETPLETFGNTEAEDVAKRYEDGTSNPFDRYEP